MCLRLTTSVLFLVLMAANIALAANTLHVPQDFATIQGAIDAAATGDTVLVSDGTYFEHIDFKGKAITVTSANGAATAILDGQHTAISIVTFQTGEGSPAVFRGFTVRNGGASFGTGIYLLGTSPTILDNVFDSNQEGSGGYGSGIGGNGASPDIERNIFRNNSCDSQYLSGVISFVNGSSPVVADNLIVGNNCRGINMTLPVGAQPAVINNTIVGNTSGIRVDARIPTALQVFENNVIVGNVIALEVDFLVPGNEPTWKHNLLFNNTVNYSGIADQTGSNGNLSIDPQFVNVPQDLHLNSGSPAVDAGDNSAPRIPSKDFDNNPRVLNGKGDCNSVAVVDLGAYEFVPPLLASFNPSGATFGNVPVNTTASAQTIRFANTGVGCLAINSIEISGDFVQTSDCGTHLSAGESCTVDVSFAPTTSGAQAGTLSLSTNAPSSPHLASLQGTGVDFVIGGPSTPVTVVAGSTAQYKIAVVEQGGAYPLQVTLRCIGLPALAACMFSPTSVTPSPDGNSGGATLTITTTAPMLAQTSSPPAQYRSIFFAVLLGMPAALCVFVRRFRSRGKTFMATIVLLGLALLMSMAACGSGGSQPKQPQGGTPPGTYMITVSGSSTAATHATTVVLQIN